MKVNRNVPHWVLPNAAPKNNSTGTAGRSFSFSNLSFRKHSFQNLLLPDFSFRSLAAYFTFLFFLFSYPPTSFAAPPAGVKLAKEQVFHKGNGVEPQSLDPHILEGVPGSNILRDLHEGLITEAPNGDLIPGSASHWDINEDGTEYIFYLRPNAKWSNGEPLTAGDFVYSWRRLIDPATASNYALMLAPLVNAEAITNGKAPLESLGVEALDDHRLKVTLNNPTPYLLGVLNHSTTYPVYREGVEKFGNKHTRPGNFVTNGPYKLVEWEIQSHIKIERNKYYWDDKNTTINTVYYYPTEDLNAEVLRYRAGELDFTYQELPSNQIPWLRKNLPNELEINPFFGNYYYGFNLTQPPFKDALNLRKALSMAVDREIITEKLLKDGSLAAYGWVPPGTFGYETQEYSWKNLSREEKLAEARRLYKEAGYSDENPLKIEIRYNTHQNHKKIALAIAAMWKENLGIITTILNQEWKVYLDVRKEKRWTQVFRAGWIGDYNDPFSFIELGLSYNEQNDVGYNSKRFDNLVAQSVVAKDTISRMALLQKAEKMLLNDYAYMPIYYYSVSRLVKPYVGGYENNVMDHQLTKNLYIIAH